MASRRKGRILAFQALYYWDASAKNEAQRVPLEELLSFAWLSGPENSDLKSGDDSGNTEDFPKKYDENTLIFSSALVAGTIENITFVDNMIKDHLVNWDITRINRVDLAILRISVYTLLYQDDIPPSIVIDEAIGISLEFGTDDSYKFINGILDNINKTRTNK